jgi:hypothetical protein
MSTVNITPQPTSPTPTPALANDEVRGTSIADTAPQTIRTRALAPVRNEALT